MGFQQWAPCGWFPGLGLRPRPSTPSKSPPGFPADTLNSMCPQSLACVLPPSLPLPPLSNQRLSNLQLGLCSSFHMSFSVFPTLVLPLLSVLQLVTPALTAPPYPLPCPCHPSKRKLLNSLSFYLQISCDICRYGPFTVVMYLYHVFLGWWFLWGKIHTFSFLGALLFLVQCFTCSRYSKIFKWIK